MNIENVITGKDTSFAAKTITVLLTPLSWLYCFAHFLFFIPYKLGIRKKHRAPIPVISVGNITMGGTGKTPFVITLSEILKDMGYRPAILSRGYGRKNTEKENLLFMPDSDLDTSDTGDEPQILSKALSVPIIIGKNRIKSLSLLKETEADIIVLDDGMQYWQLHKDIEISVSSLSMPFGTGKTIPAGNLRESKNGLKRCRFIILTSDKKHEDTETTEKVRKLCRNSFVYQGFTSPSSITYKNENHNTDFIKDKKVFAFSGIANPERFLSSLKSLGADVISFRKYPDHYNYTEKDIKELKDLGKKADITVTTAKDSVKLPKDFDYAVLNIYTEIAEDFRNKLADML